MPPPATPSPQLGPTLPIDEANLPSGQCRYILLNPEIKGHRCACVGFTLNRNLPSVTCECGHSSCFHIKEVEKPTDRAEIEQLYRRIQALEEQLDRERQGGLGSAIGTLIGRLGDLEEQYERGREEISQESRSIYGQIKRVWHSVEQLGQGQAEAENRYMALDKRLTERDKALDRLTDRVEEGEENTVDLEDRLESLEEQMVPFLAAQINSPEMRTPHEDTRSTAQWDQQASESPEAAEGSATQPSDIGRRESIESTPVGPTTVVPWTVHISLLPSASLPFPFEKDTTAYKRCLSRGLHQMVAVRGTDSDSFSRAVEKAFGRLLQGRSWVPLQARLCDAESLLGLPMLRRLDTRLLGISNYNQEFLRQHCAVCGPNGTLDSLYIAMESDSLSWHFLWRSPCHTDDLEDSWQYDPLLDPNDPKEDDSMDDERRPPAGDIVPTFPTSLKRAASEISRTTSFSPGSTADGAGARHKVPRTTCVQVPVEVRRRVETV